MWRAWVFFNLSHSLGIVLFGVLVVLVGRTPASFGYNAAVFLPLAAVVSIAYLSLGVAYSFRTPIIGIGLSVFLFSAAWVLYQALSLIPAGLLLAASGAWWPWPERRASDGTQLGVFVPDYQFVEFHETRVRGTPEAAYRAIREVRADEIRTFRTLTWIRSPRLPWRRPHESIMDPGREPILDVATRTGFVWLADEPGHESAVGAVVCCRPTRLASAEQFRGLTEPGVAKAGMNFRVEDLGGGTCRVTTETRVFATATATRRRFGLYWAFIYPGSSLIRHGWLAAIKRRAEADDPAASATP